SKAELRRQARAHRKALHAADPQAAARAATHAKAMLDVLFGREAGWADEMAAGRRLTAALYRPRGAEIDTGPLARALAALSCDLALPCVETLDAPLVFRAWSPGRPLRLDLVGSAAPPPDAAAAEPDLIVTPLLAFDAV